MNSDGEDSLLLPPATEGWQPFSVARQAAWQGWVWYRPDGLENGFSVFLPESVADGRTGDDRLRFPFSFRAVIESALDGGAEIDACAESGRPLLSVGEIPGFPDCLVSGSVSDGGVTLVFRLCSPAEPPDMPSPHAEAVSRQPQEGMSDSRGAQSHRAFSEPLQPDRAGGKTSEFSLEETMSDFSAVSKSSNADAVRILDEFWSPCRCVEQELIDARRRMTEIVGRFQMLAGIFADERLESLPHSLAKECLVCREQLHSACRRMQNCLNGCVRAISNLLPDRRVLSDIRGQVAGNVLTPTDLRERTHLFRRYRNALSRIRFALQTGISDRETELLKSAEGLGRRFGRLVRKERTEGS